MGFLRPTEPPLELESWRTGDRSQKMRPIIRFMSEVGFGTPDVVYLMYALKIGLYLLGAAGFALTTDGIDGFTSIGTWWNEPIVFQKLVLWTILFEVLGLGCGFGPLNLRFVPPLGAFLFWLRPGTVRLPPWPTRVPLTRGATRSWVDVALYAALLVSLVVALVADADRPATGLGASVGLLATWQVALVAALLTVIGLRDRTIFLAARAEVYLPMLVAFLFAPVDMVVVCMLVMLVVWWGAALSKVNHHFPFVVQAMEANSPIWRFGRLKHRFHRNFPDDLMPSRLSRVLAHGGTVVEFAVPLLLIVSVGGPLTYITAAVMVLFHLHILTSIPMGVPLEWNVFMILGVLMLFVHHAELGVGDLTTPWVLLVPAVSAAIALFGNFFPTKVSFLPGMRYYAGNWDTTVWCFTPAGVERFNAGTGVQMPQQQLEKVYGSAEQAELSLYAGYAFRAMYTHGRAHFSLLPRLVEGRPESEYLVLDGEPLVGAVLGWNFGDGHLHDERLITELQRRCGFEPGDVRVLILDAQPIHRGTQQYRLIDAAEGEFERGYVEVRDMMVRQPGATDVPIHVTRGRDTETSR